LKRLRCRPTSMFLWDQATKVMHNGCRVRRLDADAVHGILMRHFAALVGCMDPSDEDRRFKAITSLEPYAGKRWPLGNVSGGNG
jgi:hypothetical protein